MNGFPPIVIAKPGTLAYFDSFAGLVPLRICTVEYLATGESLIIAKATAARGPYKRGEEFRFTTKRLSPWEPKDSPIIGAWLPGKLIPRTAVYRSRQHCGQYRIRAYQWRIEE